MKRVCTPGTFTGKIKDELKDVVRILEVGRMNRMGLFLLAIPLLAQDGVNSYRVQKERALGRSLAAEIRKETGPAPDAAIEAYVRRVGQELSSRMGDPALALEFEAISSRKWTEPLSLPGGTVFVPVRSLANAQDESEFMAMLAHAIGHTALGHGRLRAGQERPVNTASIPLVFVGSASGSHAETRGNSQPLMPVQFVQRQRAFEIDADRFGVELAARSGYDPRALQRYLERTHPDSGPANSALPDKRVRIAAVQDALSGLPTAGFRSSSEEFQRVQSAARAILDAMETERLPPTLRR